MNGSNWIAVKDRLPDDNLAVMVFTPGYDEEVWIGWRDGDDGWRSGDAIPLFDDVTHWMPLPEPPPGAR